MPWRLVRLEHGPTREFPLGSAARAYLLRIPLQSNGRIDTDTHGLDPKRSTVRRYWPNEQDRSGYVVRGEAIWELVSGSNPEEAEVIGWFEDCKFSESAIISITEPENKAIPFEVADIRVD